MYKQSVSIVFMLVVSIAVLVSSENNVCPRACSHIYEPICGFNGNEYKVFGSRCKFDGNNDCDLEKDEKEFVEVDMKDCKGEDDNDFDYDKK